MPLICPACSARALSIVISLELPPDASNDEITLQLAECPSCGARGVAVYEESRRGSEPAWYHTLYALDDAELDRLAALVRECPHPRQASCACVAHRTLGAQRSDGAWSIGDVARVRSLAGQPIPYEP